MNSNKLRSLEPEDIKRVCDLIRGFRIAMSNLLLYPPDSSLPAESTSNVGVMISAILEKYRVLILSDAEGVLLANTVRLDVEEKDVSTGIFGESLDVCNVKSITFRQGITVEELRFFLEELAKKLKLKGAGDSIAEILAAEKVRHIALNERVYAAIGDSDIVIERGAELIEMSGGSIDAIMEALHGVTEMVSSIGNEPTRDKVKLEIAEKLIATDPKLLVELVKRRPHVEEASDVKMAPGVKAGEVGFSQTEMKAIVSDVTVAYQKLTQGDEKGLPSLKSAIDRILSLSKDRIPSLELYNELIQQTDVSFAPVEVQAENAAETTKEQLEALLQQDTLSLITDSGTENMKRLIESSVSEEELEVATKLCDKLAKNFGAVVSDVRHKTASAFGKLYSAIETPGKEEIVQSLDDKLIETEEKESHEETYSEVASVLVRTANRALKDGNRKKALEIIQLFKKHAYGKTEKFRGRRKLAEDAMRKLADSELMRLLLDDFCSPDEAKRKEVTSLIVGLGDSGVSCLIRRIKETGNIETRKSIAFLLERIGETAVARLVEELSVETNAEISLRIIELLDKIGHVELVVEQLRKTLSNPDFQVRRTVIYKLSQLGTLRAQQVILDVMPDDPSPVIRRTCVGLLAEMRYVHAVTELVKMLSSRHMPLGKMGESIQQEICGALGRIGDISAIPALREAARPPRSFRPVKSERVRVAAVQALADLGDQEIGRFVRDRNSLVRRIVSDAR